MSEVTKLWELSHRVYNKVGSKDTCWSMFLVLNLCWYSKWHFLLHSSHSTPKCYLEGHTLIKNCSKKTYVLWLKSKRIDCFISIRIKCFLFGNGWQLSIPLHLPVGQQDDTRSFQVLWAKPLAMTFSSKPCPGPSMVTMNKFRPVTDVKWFLNWLLGGKIL